ncbi:MAG: phosphodiester glycosidase family protein [Candidatus Eremiobacteraeota bacterium]|nr:phosphodiester glycosidase family protein [Candidatus Eremiobacteraeota bacterium]
MVKSVFFVALMFAATFVRAYGAELLPERVAPDAPFPRIFEEAPTIEAIAPGVEYADYQMLTAAGPLAIHVVAVAPHRSDVRVETLLADNALESKGETVGSMAKRTGAIAGINGDYFDIGNTNRPLNIVVRNGVLLQMPRKRFALAIGNDGTPSIAEYSFIGQVTVGSRALAIDGVDELPPPNGGTSLITPEYGPVPPLDNVTLIALQPLDGTPPVARYRVTELADTLKSQPAGYYVAIGAAAYNGLDMPAPGDVVSTSGELTPGGFDQVAMAIGGGPLILDDGAWYEDPDGPNGGEYSKRIPCSGAAITADGRLFLIEVDGREPTLSVGLTRPEFSSLMRALGAIKGMAFDGGGSSTIVARRLGDEESAVVNVPSDGRERPVADGVFVYSTAPVGPAVRLVARPGVVRAVSGAEVPLHVAAVDAANHVAGSGNAIEGSVEPSRLGVFRDGSFTALAPGTGRIVLRSGELKGEIGLEVERTPARIGIAPQMPNVEKGGTLTLKARAFDARGYGLVLPPLLPWSASAGSIDAQGLYRAGGSDANVEVRVGEAVATARVTVGSHDVALPFAEHAHFTTIPHGGEGSAQRNSECGSCLDLSYSFGNDERAAYAVADLTLPPDTVGLAFDVQDDGSAARLRVALRNSINESVLVDAAVLDQPGWRTLNVRFPAEVGQAARLTAIYVLPPKGMQVSEGQITLRNVRAIVAGNH